MSTTNHHPQETSPIDRVRRFVQAYDPALDPIVFAESLHTSEAAAHALGVEVAQIAKSILFRSENGFGLFVAAGDVRINSKVVKQSLGGKKAKMATPDEVLEVTGYRVGAVCPFALVMDVPVFIDQSLQRFDMVYTAAGIVESVLPVRFDQLVGLTRGVVVNAAGEELS